MTVRSDEEMRELELIGYRALHELVLELKRKGYGDKDWSVVMSVMIAQSLQFEDTIGQQLAMLDVITQYAKAECTDAHKRKHN